MFENKLLNYQTKAKFLEEKSQIKDDSIVFIQDTREIWTHNSGFQTIPLGGEVGQVLTKTKEGFEWKTTQSGGSGSLEPGEEAQILTMVDNKPTWVNRWVTLEKQIITELKKWDFTSWSSDTISNITQDTTTWSNDEKGDGNTVEGCYWQVTAGSSTIKANGSNISELSGLEFINNKDKSLAIATNYPSTSLGTYQGSQYLWLGGSNINYFIIPNVLPGTTIKMGIESHKSTDPRGVYLYVGRNESGTQLMGTNGGEVDLPTTYKEQVWQVPVNDSGLNSKGAYDITVRNTNGCHIYFIETTIVIS